LLTKQTPGYDDLMTEVAAIRTALAAMQTAKGKTPFDKGERDGRPARFKPGAGKT
jgi:hypothetical protein